MLLDSSALRLDSDTTIAVIEISAAKKQLDHLRNYVKIKRRNYHGHLCAASRAEEISGAIVTPLLLWPARPLRYPRFSH